MIALRKNMTMSNKETNNGPEIVDTNQFVANVFIKPARSINFVTLNFVGVRSGVEFSEVVGTV